MKIIETTNTFLINFHPIDYNMNEVTRTSIPPNCSLNLQTAQEQDIPLYYYLLKMIFGVEVNNTLIRDNKWYKNSIDIDTTALYSWDIKHEMPVENMNI